MCFKLFLNIRRFSTIVTQSPQFFPSLLSSKIKGLVQQGRCWEAIYAYAKETHFPLYTSKFTFPSLLKACASIPNLPHGKALHSTIIALGLQFDPYITASLVNVYVKCGSLSDAVQVFDNVSKSEALAQDVTVWNSMLDGLFKNGLIEDGFAQFCRMQLLGVRSDGYSLSILLGVLDGRFDIRSGRKIHGYVIRHSFNDDPFVVTALIDMYSGCGRPVDACCVFERLENKNNAIVVWNAMINGFSANGWWEDSLELYSLAKNEVRKLESSTFSSALVACSQLEDVDFGRQVQCDVLKVGFQDELYVCTSMLTMYAKFGLVEEAEQVFDSLVDKRVEIWNSMISAYIGNNHAYNALYIYHQMQSSAVPSDSFTISDMLVCCSMIKLYDFGRALHAEIIKRPIQNNIAVQSSLLNMYSKCGSLEEALKVFSNLEAKDKVAWGSILSGCSENGKFEKALDLFKAMESDGMKPDSNIMASVISACAELDNLDLVCCIHADVIKRGLEWDAFVGSSLMDTYSKYKQLELVKFVFSNILHKNLVIWNCLISCYCENGLPDLSISLLPQIMQHGLYPDSVSFTTTLLAVSSEAALLKGKAIHSYQIRLQIHNDIQVENALVDMYMKCGSLRYAQGIFRNMSERNLVTWNSMIAGYGSHGECLKAIYLFNEMRVSGISPDDVTFLSLISSCNHAGFVNEGLNLFGLMKEYRIEPRMEHYINMVDLLGRAGCLDDAYRLICNMPVEPDQGVWLCLLSACRLNNNVDLGELVAHNLLKMDPTRGSNYVQLLNLYVGAGLLDKAAKLRASMRQRGLKKIPGCSWIEVKNKVDVFFSGDSSSSKTIEIHESLKNLRSNMKLLEDPLEALEAV